MSARTAALDQRIRALWSELEQAAERLATVDTRLGVLAVEIDASSAEVERTIQRLRRFVRRPGS